MNIEMLGVDYVDCPLAVRSAVAFNADECVLVSKMLLEIPKIEEAVLLSTCNRTELYVAYTGKRSPKEECLAVLCRRKKISPSVIEPFFHSRKDALAIHHLFNVTAGLHSMILGEDQILGQVKRAAELAQTAGCLGNTLRRIFAAGIAAAKRTKNETEISRLSISVGTIATNLIKKSAVKPLPEINVLVIGTGETGVITVKNLVSAGICSVTATNRSHRRMQDLSAIFPSLNIVPYAERYRYIPEQDVVISCTSSPHFTIEGDRLLPRLHRDRPLLLLDLAVPRDINVDPGLPGITQYHIDELGAMARENEGRRIKAAGIAQQTVWEDAEKCIGTLPMQPSLTKPQIQ